MYGCNPRPGLCLGLGLSVPVRSCDPVLVGNGTMEPRFREDMEYVHGQKKSIAGKLHFHVVFLRLFYGVGIMLHEYLYDTRMLPLPHSELERSRALSAGRSCHGAWNPSLHLPIVGVGQRRVVLHEK